MALLVVLSRMEEGTMRVLGLLVLSIYPLVYIRGSRSHNSSGFGVVGVSAFPVAFQIGGDLDWSLVSEGSEWSLDGMGSDWSLDDEGSGWS